MLPGMLQSLVLQLSPRQRPWECMASLPCFLAVACLGCCWISRSSSAPWTTRPWPPLSLGSWRWLITVIHRHRQHFAKSPLKILICCACPTSFPSCSHVSLEARSRIELALLEWPVKIRYKQCRDTAIWTLKWQGLSYLAKLKTWSGVCSGCGRHCSGLSFLWRCQDWSHELDRHCHEHCWWSVVLSSKISAKSCCSLLS